MNKQNKNMKSDEKKHTETQQQEESKQKQQQAQEQHNTNQQQPQETDQQEPSSDQETSQQQEGQAEQEQTDSQEGAEKEEGKKKKKKKQQEAADKSEKKKEPAEKSDKEKLAELQDRYLRLQAEYDNYRKRTLKEKMELTRSAGEDILKGLLPVMDDFERALQSIDETENAEALKDGVHLIYNKFKEFLKQQGVQEMESQDQEFNTDRHEAISKVPAPSEEMKGKVVDVVQTGYFLNDKVLRFAKVVVGE